MLAIGIVIIMMLINEGIKQDIKYDNIVIYNWSTY